MNLLEDFQAKGFQRYKIIFGSSGTSQKTQDEQNELLHELCVAYCNCKNASVIRYRVDKKLTRLLGCGMKSMRPRFKI